MFVQCHVHDQPFPRATSHEHHEVPQAAGGGDEATNRLFVCANCHTTLHQLATKMRKGAMGEVEDIVVAYAGTLRMRGRLLKLAHCVAVSMLEKDEGIVEGPTMVKIQVVVHKTVAARLRLLANEHRVKGRKVGVSRYLGWLIERNLKEKGLWPWCSS